MSCRGLQSGNRNRTILLRQYRRFQLLSRLHNNVFKDPIMPAVIMVIILIQSTSLYVLVTLGTEITLAILGLFFVVAIDCFIVIQCFFKIMSYPYTRSVKVMKLARKGIINCSKWEVKFIKSCYQLKVGMGNDTFFDRMTSLIIWKTSTDILITFLLM